MCIDTIMLFVLLYIIIVVLFMELQFRLFLFVGNIIIFFLFVPVYHIIPIEILRNPESDFVTMGD